MYRLRVLAEQVLERDLARRQELLIREQRVLVQQVRQLVSCLSGDWALAWLLLEKGSLAGLVVAGVYLDP